MWPRGQCPDFISLWSTLHLSPRRAYTNRVADSHCWRPAFSGRIGSRRAHGRRRRPFHHFRNGPQSGQPWSRFQLPPRQTQRAGFGFREMRGPPGLRSTLGTACGPRRQTRSVPGRRRRLPSPATHEPAHQICTQNFPLRQQSQPPGMTAVVAVHQRLRCAPSQDCQQNRDPSLTCALEPYGLTLHTPKGVGFFTGSTRNASFRQSYSRS